MTLVLIWYGMSSNRAGLDELEGSPTYTDQDMDEQVVLSSTRFGLALYQELVREKMDSASYQNVLISPYSLFAARSMVYNGANGTFLAAMQETLHLDQIDLAVLNHSQRAMMDVLKYLDERVRLYMANSLWGRDAEEVAFYPEFVSTMEEYCQGQLELVDFSDPRIIPQINGLVEQETRGGMEEIISEIEDNTILILLNALYFYGPWATPFDEQQTQLAPFYLADGSVTEHALMYRYLSAPYFENEDFQAIQLPYGQGEFGMYVFYRLRVWVVGLS